MPPSPHLSNGVVDDAGRLLKLFNALPEVHLHQTFDCLQLALVQEHVDGLQPALHLEFWHCMGEAINNK